MKSFRFLFIFFCSFFLFACSTLKESTEIAAEPAPQWFTPQLPHSGNITDLKAWWQRWVLPPLADWIDSAQQKNPTLANARVQLEASRYNRALAMSSMFPSVNAQAGVGYANDGARPEGTTATIGLQASWELGIWGQHALGLEGVQAQRDYDYSTWHEARVLVAVEVAQQVFGYYACRHQAAILQEQAASLQKVAQLQQSLLSAGFVQPSTVVLSQAQAAQTDDSFQEQQLQCENSIKALVALIGVSEPDLRQQLQNHEANFLAVLERKEAFEINAVPAQVIAQRPDIYRAQKNIVIRSVDVGIARADLLPNLQFSGYITRNFLYTKNDESAFNTWSVGPLSINLPLFNRSSLQAKVDVSLKRYEAAIISYQAAVRNAVREVEQTLLKLHSVNMRLDKNQAVLQQYRDFFTSQQKRAAAGLSDQITLEEAHRQYLNVERIVINLRQERMNTWLGVYQALGGGFEVATEEQKSEEDKNQRDARILEQTALIQNLK